jgi:TfoX/Sxy family transcriptional regulator of competence genes
MAYDEVLAGRMRSNLERYPEIVEKKMFGGIGFLLHGNMACGVNKGDLIIRVGPDSYAQALEQPHTRPFDMTGKPMTGWIVVEPQGYREDEDLASWIDHGINYAQTLPPK